MYIVYTDRDDACRLWSVRDPNLILRWTLGFLPHTAGLPSVIRFIFATIDFAVFDTYLHGVNIPPLTDMLNNHMGVMPARVRTIVSTPVSPRQDSNSHPHHWH